VKAADALARANLLATQRATQSELGYVPRGRSSRKRSWTFIRGACGVRRGVPRSGPKIVETLEQGLASEPDHIGLLHFYIHAVEASSNPSRVRSGSSASRPPDGARSGPSRAHAGHIYICGSGTGNRPWRPMGTPLLTHSTIASATTRRLNAHVPTAQRSSLTPTSPLAAEGRKSDVAAAKTHFEAARQHRDVPLTVKDL
jgi:hypothetical protein